MAENILPDELLPILSKAFDLGTKYNGNRPEKLPVEIYSGTNGWKEFAELCFYTGSEASEVKKRKETSAEWPEIFNRIERYPHLMNFLSRKIDAYFMSS